MKNHCRSCCCFIAAAVVIVCFTDVSSLTGGRADIASQYPDSSSTADRRPIVWTSLAVDPASKRVYAGAMNRLFVFDDDLSPIQTTDTGPVLDNPRCYSNFTGNPCLNADGRPLSAVSTDNHNRVLAVDARHGQLVTCGSVFQGTCQTRTLSNISNSTDYAWPFSQYVIVASKNYPTVAFVGPGPFGDDVLYVGTSYDGVSPTDWLLAKFLAGVSSRNLTQPGTFLVTEFDDDVQTYGTRAILTQEAAAKYRVNFVAGFGHEGFSYFLTTQPEPFNLAVVSNVLTSKLIQVCQNDQHFYSYVEMRILCTSGGGGTDYNLVQAAAVVKPGANLAAALNLTTDDTVLLGVFATANQAASGTAICVYPFTSIRRRFTENIQKCYDSVTDQTMVGPQFVQNRQCTAFSTNISETYCGSAIPTISTPRWRNSPLVGTIPLTAVPSAALVLRQINVTAVDTAVVDGRHTVAFLGTSTGRLLKVLVDSINATVYEDSDVGGGSPVNQDLLLTPDKSHLYVMTTEKIYKVPVSNCQQYTSCEQCLTAKDPFCGWCSLESSCRRRSECLDDELSGRWLTPYYPTHGVCPRVTVTPLTADIKTNIDVTINVTLMPQLKSDEYFNCVFEALGRTTRAAVTGSIIVCSVAQSIATLPASDDSVALVLSVKMSRSSMYFIQTNITFYDCNRHTVCSSCIGAPWSCRWCIFANKCQNSTSACPFDSSVQQKQFCPGLVTDPSRKEILIPVGVESTISMAAKNLPVPQANEKGYICEILSAGQQTKSISAVRVNSSLITCASYAFPAGSDSSYTASVRVIWGDGFLIEGNSNITVFDCASLSDGDCNRCLSLQYPPTARFECGWCGDSCRPNTTACSSSPSSSVEDRKCPLAVITSVVPQSGPKEGGTRITIGGANLGYRFDKVQVSIEGTECDGVSAQYVISKQFVCITKSVSSPGQRSLAVRVSGETANYQDSRFSTFTFTDPVVDDIQPLVGPEAGGTPLTLSGKDLNTGSNTSVFLDQQPCYVDGTLTNETQIVCLTSSSNSSLLTTTSVNVQFDNAVRVLNRQFRYVENPQFNKILPSGSFQAGGCLVSVTMTNLDSIARINLSLENSNGSNTPVAVTYKGPSVIQFRSPSVPQIGNSYQLQMSLDGIRSSLPFSIFSNPSVQRFSGDVRPYGDTIQIMGQNMLVPCMDNYQSEVRVYVGSQLCNISSLTDSNLYCRPPNKAPDGKSRVPVKVTVGNRLIFDVGDLDYQMEPTSILWPIIVGVIGGVLVIIIVVLIFVFCLMSSKSERQYGKLQAQMEALESGVRNECKQAFTELQTDVSDFTSDINIIGIPFWEYKTYAFKLLFPMDISHQVLYITSPNGRRLGEFSDKMLRFNQLLSSKYFLLTFIHTMEKHPQNFGMEDRSKVASLLSVILMDKMEYATEIIKILLDELIIKSLENRAPKLMLRRTETVVEKLLANWLSLSMYGYLKANAGRALFMLYKAVKHQTEKGPIDAVTAEAKYSLSEDRLLREKIEAKTLIVTVYEAENTGQLPMTCKMLDCDTITQAKEKALDAIYKNTPFSKRPTRNSVELRWSAGKHLDGYPAGNLRDFLPLNDQDVTTEPVGGWKQVNTLSHYHIKDGSVFQLHKNEKKESLHLVHGAIEMDTGTRLNTIRLEEGVKVWHLAKHEDASNNINRTQKVISEIFLTRLLQTKMTLQQYVDDLFTTVLEANNSLPPTVKYLYDFLDGAAQRYGITDSDVVHAWKSNSLPLRFWVNLIKNPEFLFDINKSAVVDCCLSVIAQTFMDSCSTHEHRLGKDSPSAKLLFAKDIPRYRQLVSQFYHRIQELPSITDEAMATMMTELSSTYSTEFNQEIALGELYEYALRFNSELHVALDNDPSAKKLRLAERFAQLRLVKDENLNNSTA